MKINNNIPLAQYFGIDKYNPEYGDFVIKTGLLSTSFGLVTDYDRETDEVKIIMSGVPFVLLTLNDAEQIAKTKSFKLSDIKYARHGTWAISKNDEQTKTIVWFI